VTKVFNDPRTFKDDMIDGFVGAYGRFVRRSPDASGVMARNAPFPGKVAVVIGGGSGHYPAFCGIVGEGLATAAVIGDIFTSPSGEQAYRVARAAEGGAGVLFSYGNYSGDVMNFGMAEMRLNMEGIECRTVLVTDDVLSAPPEEIEKRRGIAGGFFVYKAAGASAMRGDELATVERIARKVNDWTRTVGIAFGGCTLPGHEEPLFTVDPDRMEVGLGIHGEAGIRGSELLPAREIAKLLVDAILADAQKGSPSRATLLVNGLGATKYEELFVLYKDVMPLLEQAGIEIHNPHVGEFVTSLDMAGCSLTLHWLDDEMQELHDATAVTPAYAHIGRERVEHASAESTRAATGTAAVARPEPEDQPEGHAGEWGRRVRGALVAARDAIENAEPELARLDAAVGDGDHGAGMVRGFVAAVHAVDGFEGTARQSLIRAGKGFMDEAGGASGALFGTWLASMGTALPVDDDTIDGASWQDALRAGVETIARIGQCAPGDKTMLDTLDPFVRDFAAAVTAGGTMSEAWKAGLAAGQRGMESTRDMVSRRGRASRLGERSRGHQDAGATSIYYVLESFGEALGTTP
jgi:dihydroxyacetone kinase phosphoprotein-dependent L subunit